MMRFLSTVILFIFILFLMPLSPAAAATTWECNVGWSNGAVTFGYGDTESAARQNLNERVSKEPFNNGTVTVTRPVSCRSTDGSAPPPPDNSDVPTPPALPRNPGTSPGKYRLSDGTIFSSNGRDAYCTYQNMEHWSFAAGKASLSSADSLPPFRNDGPCPVVLPAGNYRQLDGLIFKSNGKDAFCAYQKVPTGFIRQLNAPVPYDRLMRNDGICAGQ